jgi:hypothetical protein
MSRNDVLLGYLHPHEVATSFHKSVMALVGWDISHNHRLNGWASIKCASGGIPEGRNELAKALLNSDCEWLFMIDADMGFEPVALDQLLALADPINRPIVGGLCFAQREAFDDGSNGFRCVPRPTIFDWVQHEDGHWRFTGRAHFPVNALVESAATGGAFLIIHRSVFERIRDDQGEVWFDRVLGTDGSLIGEDISFFVRCQALNIPLYIHTGIRTTHLKQLWLGEADFWQSFYAPPAIDKIDILIPVLHRPQNIEPLMRSLTASTGLARAWFIVEEGDDAIIAEVERCGGFVLQRSGSFAQKVNWAYQWLKTSGQDTDAPWVFLAGDDVRFRPGWLDHAQDVARRYTASVVGTNDLTNPRVMRGEHATHMMISKTYIEEQGASWDGPGTICHEGYHHWFVDDEIVSAAKQRRTFQVALASEVEHIHPMGGKAPNDEIYDLGDAKSEIDERHFKARFKKHIGK